MSTGVGGPGRATMQIRIVNPNTTWSMTRLIGAAAASVAGPGTVVEAVSPAMGPASIESHYDEALAVPGLLSEIERGEAEGVDGYVIACFGDPGLEAARELASGPVVGIAEAAMRTAGIEVVHPETMPFAGQVGLLASSALVIGTAGSAFHTSVFCEHPPRIVGLAYGPVLNANYALIDALAGNDARYVHSPDVTALQSDAATFCYQASDPAALAHALIRSI